MYIMLGRATFTSKLNRNVFFKMIKINQHKSAVPSVSAGAAYFIGNHAAVNHIIHVLAKHMTMETLET